MPQPSGWSRATAAMVFESDETPHRADRQMSMLSAEGTAKRGGPPTPAAPGASTSGAPFPPRRMRWRRGWAETAAPADRHATIPPTTSRCGRNHAARTPPRAIRGGATRPGQGGVQRPLAALTPPMRLGRAARRPLWPAPMATSSPRRCRPSLSGRRPSGQGWPSVRLLSGRTDTRVLVVVEGPGSRVPLGALSGCVTGGPLGPGQPRCWGVRACALAGRLGSRGSRPAVWPVPARGRAAAAVRSLVGSRARGKGRWDP